MSMGYADVRRAGRGVAAAMVMVAVLVMGVGVGVGLGGCVVPATSLNGVNGGLKLGPTKTETLITRVEKEIAAQGLVGLSVAVALNGDIELEGHWGFEDREAVVEASESTMYRWASISKPVTAVAAMQLVERGKLDLLKDVRVYVPEFPVTPKPILPMFLLCHRAGIVHYSNGPVVRTPPPKGVVHPYADVVTALRTFQASPLVAEPGEKYSYTTHGYMLLGAVVERAGKEQFWKQVRTRIAGPAEMQSFRPDYQWERIPHRAVGYRKVGVGPEATMERSTDTDVSWKLAGGGFISTVGDLSRFSIALMDGRLVDGASMKAMWTAQGTPDGVDGDGYGLGFQIRMRDGEREVSHSGSQEKAATMLVMIPGKRLSVAVMSNTEGARLADLARDIAELVKGEVVAK